MEGNDHYTTTSKAQRIGIESTSSVRCCRLQSVNPKPVGNRFSPGQLPLACARCSGCGDSVAVAPEPSRKVPAMTVIPFHFDLSTKAADTRTVELENGALLIEGTGANYAIDRESEAFLDGSFSKGLARFLAGNAPLLYHHAYDKVIGRVIDAKAIPGVGVRIKAIVDPQPESSPLRWIWEGIRRGRINGLSAGGIFTRVQTPAGPRISEVDILEWSATPVPVGRGTTFDVVAGKALAAPSGIGVGGAPYDDLPRLRAQVDRMAAEVIEWKFKRMLETVG